MLCLALGTTLAACETRSFGPGRATGPGGQSDGGPPSTASVTVSNLFFQSDRNGTVNPALDTVAVGGTVTWIWRNTDVEEHSVRSLSTPGFPSSPVAAGDGTTHSATFATAGTFNYDCEVHGSLETGSVVVR